MSLLGRGRSRRLGGWNDDGGRWTRDRLRGDESWRRLGRLDWSRGLRAGYHGVGHRRRRPGRNGRRRSHGGPGSGRGGLTGRRNGTRRNGRLLGSLRNGLQHIPGLGNVRQVDLRLEFVGRRRGRARAPAAAGRLLGKVFFDALGFIYFDGTGVRFLLGYADLGKNVEDRLALDLKFSGQIIDSNLMLHSALFPPSLCPVRLPVHSILTV